MRKEDNHSTIEPAPLGIEPNTSNQIPNHMMRFMQYNIVQCIR